MPTSAQIKANATRIFNQQNGIPTVRQQRAAAKAAKANGQPPPSFTANASTGRPNPAPPPPPRPQAPPPYTGRRRRRRPFAPFTSAPPPPPPPPPSSRPSAPLPSWVNAGPKPTTWQLKLAALVALEAAVKESMNPKTLTEDQRKGWLTYQKCKSLALGSSVGPEAASALRMATVAIVKLVF